MHGPERNFDLEVAFDDAGVIRSMKMRALDNVGAYAGRSPFQLGKPISAIVGPYRIKSVQYQAIAVTHQQDRAGGGARLRPVADQLRDRAHDRRGGEPSRSRPPRGAAAQPDPHSEEFPYLIPSGTTYDSGDYHTVIDKVLAQADYAALIAERDRLRAAGAAGRHRHRRVPGAERRQLDVRAAAQSARTVTTTPMILPHQRRSRRRDHGDDPHHVGRAGPRDAGRHRGRRGAGDRSRSHPGGARRTSLNRCRATARSAAAWRSCWAAPRFTRRRSSRPS